MAANSWMQHPVGYTIDPDTGRPVLNDIGDGVHQPGVHLGLHPRDPGGAGHRRRGDARRVGVAPAARAGARSRRSALLALVVLVPASCCSSMVGSQLGVIETTYQPMKIAAAEAQWETCQPCSFSVFQIGGTTTTRPRPRSSRSRTCCRCWPPAPGTARSSGSTSCRPSTRPAVRPGRLRPERVHPVLVDAGDGLRRHAGLPVRAVGHLAAAGAEAADVPGVPAASRPGPCRCRSSMNTAGWLLTESGRQPWIVQGLMKTDGRRVRVGLRHRDHDQPRRRSTRSTSCSIVRRRRAHVALRPARSRRARREPPHPTTATLPALTLLTRPDEEDPMNLARSSGSSSSPSSGRASSSSRASTSAWARCTRWSADPRPSGGTAINTIGAVLGRQRGLAGGGAARDVRRVPRLVRHLVLGALPRARAAARRAHRPRRLVRVARQGRPAGGAAPGAGAHRRAASSRRCCSASRSATCSPGCRSMRTATSPAAFVEHASPAYGVWTGLTLVALCLLHGATFLAIRTTGELRQRAREIGRMLGSSRSSWSSVFAVWTAADGAARMAGVRAARGRAARDRRRLPRPAAGSDDGRVRRDGHRDRRDGRLAVREPVPRT